MDTRILTVGAGASSGTAITEAATLLRDGQVVALPTETVYGLAGRADSKEAVERIFAAKNRPADNPLIVHLAEPNQIDAVAEVSPSVRPLVEKLVERFWPGPLTLVLPAKQPYVDTVCRGLSSIAVRIPDHPVFRGVIKAAGVPLAAPSANLSGKPSPTRAVHVHQDMQGRIPLILDGGPCALGIESTVLDLSEDVPAVLRPGLVTVDQIRETLSAAVQPHNKKNAAKSPGTRYRHYSPDARVFLMGPGVSDAALLQLCARLKGKAGKIAYIGARPLDLDDSVVHFPLQPSDLAREIYRLMREMDAQHVTHLLVDGVVEEREGQSIMDRLRRAAFAYLLDDAAVLDLLEQPHIARRGE